MRYHPDAHVPAGAFRHNRRVSMFALKNWTLLPDLLLRAVGLVLATLVHNLAKARAIELAFWHLAVDQVPGGYVEFGVASGNSMRSAEIAERRAFLTSLGTARVERNLYGFDTFEGFASTSPDDSHATWQGSRFSVDIDRVRTRFRSSRGRVSLFALNAETTTDADGNPQLPLADFVDEDAIACALMDMDLGEPTWRALEWIEPTLVSGSIVIFDEYLSFRGNPSDGEVEAWSRSLGGHPAITARVLTAYADGGVAFQLTRA